MRGGATAGLVVVLAVAACFIASLFFTPSRPHFIAPSREGDVMAFVKPLTDRGFAGHRIGNIRIEKSEIWLQLTGDSNPGDEHASCALPWAAPPGGVLLTHGSQTSQSVGASGVRSVTSGPVTLSWALCGTGAEAATAVAGPIVAALAENGPNELWQRPRSTAFDGVAASLGVTPKPLVAMFLAAWLVVAAGAAPLVNRRASGTLPRADQRGWSIWALAIMLIYGSYVRINAVAHRVVDGDEGWAHPGIQGVLGQDHDALVHPPLYRGIQQLWARTVEWSEGDPMWLLRVPSVVASVLALAFVAMAIRSAGKSAWRVVPFAIIAFPANAAPETVLARPYALASLLVALTIATLWDDAWKTGGRIRFFVGATAAALAAWADYVAGIGALMAIAVVCVSRTGRARWVLPIIVAAGCALLVPAALIGASTGVLPDAYAGIDLRPIHGVGHGSFWTALGSIASFAVAGTTRGWELSGVFVLIVVGVVGIRSRRLVMVWPLLMVVLLAVLDTTFVSLRTRHLLFLPFGTVVALAMCADPLVSWIRQFKPYRRVTSA